MKELHTTEAFEEGVDELARQVAEDEQTVVFGEPDEVLRTSVVQALVERLQGAVVVRIPTAPDQIERVYLDIGAQLGAQAARAVDEALQRQPERVSGLLEPLLADRPLVVDGRDHVGDLGSGTDEGLRFALKPQLAELSAFFDDHAVLVVTSGRPTRPFAGGEAPFTVDDSDPSDIWTSFGCQTTTHQLWLSLQTLQGSAVDEGVPEYLPDPDTLRNQLSLQLSDPESQLLDALCAHARPLPWTIVDTLSLRSAVRYGAKLRLWYTDQRSVWVTRGWSRWWRDTHSTAHQRDSHQQLAVAFHGEANRGAPEDVGPSLLEALRHYTRAGDDEQAKRCARYGVGTLVERARHLSKQRRFRGAASIYEFVVESAEHDPPRLPVGRQLHAYALHYMHYNRDRANGAPLEETLEGYQRACKLWPENANFWSHLVQAHLADNDSLRALEAFAAAKANVPEHKQKYAVLLAGTIEELLEAGTHKLDAALLWADHQPRTHREQMAFGALRFALEEGWETSWLRIPDGPHLAFHRLVRVRLEYVERKQRWLAELPELHACESGNDPAQALSTMVEALRQETRTLVRALTHRLSAKDRLRKQQLLGTIDIVASALQAKVPEHVWVLGELEQGDEELVFRTSEGSRHELSPAVRERVELERHPRFARFATDLIGRPRGTVLELSKPFRGGARELLEALRKQQASG